MHTKIQSIRILTWFRHRWRQRNKWSSALVQHPVHDHAERINVHGSIIRLSPINLRSHVTIGSGFGCFCGMISSFSNTKVPEFIISFFIDKDILRLNIPMKNVMPHTAFQRIADIQTDLYHCTFIRTDFLMPFQILWQRCQQFHPDIDIISGIRFVLYNCMIFITDDIAVPFEFAHQSKFGSNIFQLTAEKFCQAQVVISVITVLLKSFC